MGEPLLAEAYSALNRQPSKSIGQLLVNRIVGRMRISQQRKGAPLPRLG